MKEAVAGTGWGRRQAIVSGNLEPQCGSGLLPVKDLSGESSHLECLVLFAPKPGDIWFSQDLLLCTNVPQVHLHRLTGYGSQQTGRLGV